MLASSADDGGAATHGHVSFVRGRFEARFADRGCATAAARDARATGFVVEAFEENPTSWLIVGRRRDAFPRDERDRYASRLNAIAAHHGGVFSRFVDESSGGQPATKGLGFDEAHL
jgi:hypothetical protein